MVVSLPKKFSHSFLRVKFVLRAFQSQPHIFDVLKIVFQKSPAQTAFWTFLVDGKMSKKRGVNPRITPIEFISFHFKRNIFAGFMLHP